MIKTAKTESLSTLIKKADELFSEMVRREDAHNGYAYEGFINCPICRKDVPWRQSDAAHVFDRDNMATRFDELNVWATCRECNRFDPDHRTRFREAIKKIIGECEFECLEERSHSMVKFTRYEIQSMINGFKQKLKKLKSLT